MALPEFDSLGVFEESILGLEDTLRRWLSVAKAIHWTCESHWTWCCQGAENAKSNYPGHDIMLHVLILAGRTCCLLQG